MIIPRYITSGLACRGSAGGAH